MFRQRLLTTLILIPLVLLGIYAANYWAFALAFGLLILGCAFEWLQLIPLNEKTGQLLFILLIGVCCLLTYWLFSLWLLLGLITWLVIFAAILTFPQSQRWWGHKIFIIAAAAIVLPLFWQSLLKITAFNHGKSLLIYLLFLVWAADIGAYLAGKQWGKHKLIPLVSPGKSWEGLVGGVVLSLLVAIIGYYIINPPQILIWFIIAVVSVLVSLFGDLFISVLKRRTGLKDTGHIIPGHGGILDRLDSLIAATPFFYGGMAYLFHGF